MNNKILVVLKNKLDELVDEYSNVGVETQRNALKEILQFYVLNFIYHHSEYKNWTMYGGSALRICHDLNRMSVDLDFEVSKPVSEKFLTKLKEEIELHFLNTYNTDSESLTIKKNGIRGLRLNFLIGDELGINHHSKQIHVKIDLNHFVAPKTVVDSIPINEYQLSFIINTYNMSSLMASKIAAILLRGQRGVGKAIYEEKGRDIYDLLWYMGKRVIPDLDYLIAKNIDVSNIKDLFDKLTKKILNNERTDENLKQDLGPLFADRVYIDNWIENWRTSYLRLLEKYEINTINTLENIFIYRDFYSGVLSFDYYYNTKEGNSVKISFKLSEYWIIFRKGELPITIDEKIMKVVNIDDNKFSNKPDQLDELKRYATLFHKKAEDYLTKTNHVILGDIITTKLIRMSAEKLNHKEQILLNRSTLLSCELDDLFK